MLYMVALRYYLQWHQLKLYSLSIILF